MYNFRLNDPHFLPHLGCDIEFTVVPGKIMTLVGENGIGKTTLAHRFWRDDRARISLVEQKSLDVFYDRPLSKIKKVFLEARRDEISEEFFHSLWEQFGLLKKEERFQSTLSGGEGQALKLCLGLARNVDCFVMDEPSQFLDYRTKEVLNEVIGELLKRNKFILLIEHDYAWLKASGNFLELGVIDGTLKGVKSWTT